MQKFTAGGHVRDAVGRPTAAATASSGRSAGWRPTPQAMSTWSTPATTGSRSSAPNGEFITDWGHRGSELGEFDFGSSQNPSQPPGGGIAVAGDHVYVADSGNDRIERFNLEGGEAMAWGTRRQRARASSPTRAGVAANENEVIVSRRRQPPHREIQPRRRVRSRSRLAGRRARAVRLPLRRRARRGRRRVRGRRQQRSRRQAHAAAGVRAEPGAATAPSRASWSSRARSRATRRATPTSRTPPTTASRCSTRTATTCARFGSSGRGPGALSAPRGLAVDPSGRLLVSDTVDDRIEAFSPGSDTYTEQWTATGGARRRLRRAGGHRHRSARIGVRRRRRQRAAGAPVGRRQLPRRNRAARPISAAPSWRARARSRSRRRPIRPTWPTPTTTACSCTARKDRCSAMGRGRR